MSTHIDFDITEICLLTMKINNIIINCTLSKVVKSVELFRNHCGDKSKFITSKMKLASRFPK